MKASKALAWVALLCCLTASFLHVAWAFNSLERGGGAPFGALGVIAAGAIDIGLVALASRLRARGRRALIWSGVLALGALSTYANLLHGLVYAQPLAASAHVTGRAAQVAALLLNPVVRAVALSAPLPILTGFLTEVVSYDVAESQRLATRVRTRVASKDATAHITPDMGLAARLQHRAERARAARRIAAADPSATAQEIGAVIGVSARTARTYLAENGDREQ